MKREKIILYVNDGIPFITDLIEIASKRHHDDNMAMVYVSRKEAPDYIKKIANEDQIKLFRVDRLKGMLKLMIHDECEQDDVQDR